MRLFRTYWPWLVPIAFLLIYEAVAVAGPAPTLSELYWRAQDAWSPLRLIVVTVVALLMAHLTLKWWRKW